MLENFAYAFNAIMPIVLLVFLGSFLKKIKFLSEEFIKVACNFSFRFALPIYLFYEIYSLKSIENIEWSISVYSVCAVILVFIIGFLVAKFLIPDIRQKGVVWQCSYRSNFALLGLILAKSLEKNSAVVHKGGTVEFLTAITIPVFNILAVVALSWFVPSADGKKANFKSIILNIIKNPLIDAIALGIVCLVFREFIPKTAENLPVFSIKENLPIIYDVISKIANIAPGFIMIALGGQFEFSDIKGMKKQIGISVFLRAVVAPLIGIGGAIVLDRWLGVFDFTAEHYIALIALFASPVATASAIMAGEMGNDERLASQLVLWTAIASMFSVFVIVVVLRSMGII